MGKKASGRARHRRVALALAALLAGCEVGPDYHRPGLPPASRYTITPETASGGQTLRPGADLPGLWWAMFRSPEITLLIERALAHNPSLEQARQALRQAQELTLAQEGNFLPQISGQFLRQRQELPGSLSGQPGFTETFTVYGAQLNLAYTFDVWGQNRRSVEADVAREDYQRFLLEGALVSLAANTATAAITVASLQAQIAAEEELIGAEQDLLRRVQAQFEAGSVTATDVATQQAQLAQTQALVAPLRIQAAQAADALAAYTGRLPQDADLPPLSLDRMSLPPDLPTGLASTLVDRRPDVRAAEAQLHAATAQIGVAVAARLPQFTLSANVGSDAIQLGQLFTPGNGAWSVLTQALAPIFEGGILLHQQRAAVAAARAAAANWRNTVLTAFQNVADALEAIRQDGEVLRANAAAEAAAARSLALAKLQFSAGGVSYLTVLTSETQYQNAVLGLVRARAARLSDTVTLFAALGGAWWNRNDVPPPPEGLIRSLLP